MTSGAPARLQTTGNRPAGIDESPVERNRWPSVVMAVAFLLAAVVLQLLRNSGSPAYDVVWAEDGGVFLDDALSASTLEAVLRPYAGYLHLVPRLVAEVVTLFPVEWAAALLAGSAAVGIALLSLYVYWASARVIPAAGARATLAVLVVLLPAAGYETNAAVNDLHWYLLFACAIAFAAARTDRVGAVAATVVAALTALSDPLAALLLPLGVVAARRRRSRAWWAPASAAAGLAVQAVAALVAYRPSLYGDVVPSDIPRIYGLRVAGSFLVGDRSLDAVAGLGTVWPAYACLLASATVLVALAAGTDRTRRVWMAVFATHSVVLLAVPVALRGTEEFFPGVFTLNGSRYTVLPLLLLYTALLSGLRLPDLRLGTAARSEAAAVVVLLWIGSLVVLNHGVLSVRDAGPGWSASLQAARQLCDDADGAPVALPGERLPGPGQVRVPVAPQVPPPHPVTVSVPCRELR